MTGNEIAKVFDFEGAFKARRKETAKWSNQRGKGALKWKWLLILFQSVKRTKHDNVKLKGSNQDRGANAKDGGKWAHRQGDGIVDWDKVLGRLALAQNTPRVRIQLDRTVEHWEAGEKSGEDKAPDQGQNAAANKTLPALLWREIDQGHLNVLFAEEETADISERVIGADQQNGQYEPNDAVEYVLHAHVA